MLTIGGIWLFLFLPNMREGQSASGAFILFLVFTVVYVLIMAAVLSFRSRMKRITRDESDYVSVYGDKEK
jgi:threonine/homoserine/homoserine lactone efflux protein